MGYQISTPSNTSSIICFSGRIGSGKTSISKGLADVLNLKWVSFGGYVHKVAKEQGLIESREVLQKIGQRLVHDNPAEFCENVLREANWIQGQSLIIDGIRHVQILNALKSLIKPGKLYLVFIDADSSTLKRRYNKRSMNQRLSLEKIEEHDTEKDVINSLPEIADLRIDGNRDKDELIKDVASWVQNHLKFIN